MRYDCRSIGLPTIACLTTLMALSMATGGKPVVAQTAPMRSATGRFISAQGVAAQVGSFPCNLALSPRGNWIAVTTSGSREVLTLVSSVDDHVTARIPFNSHPKGGSRAALYYGLAFSRRAGETRLYVSRGPEDLVSVYRVTGTGGLQRDGDPLHDPSHWPGGLGTGGGPNFLAGIAVNSTGTVLYTTRNESSSWTDEHGSVGVLSTRTGKVLAQVTTPGFPYAIAAVTAGPLADKRLYVASERDGVVSDIDVTNPAAPVVLRNIPTGTQPEALLLNHSQTRLFVANAGSDTVTALNPATDAVEGAILMRPSSVRGLPGCTPTGLALSPDDSTLYVALADMNAIAVVRFANGGHRFLGYIPTGWYPTAVGVSSDGERLFVTNAKGIRSPSPNARQLGPGGRWGTYILDILEGSLSMMSVPRDADMPALTAQSVHNATVANVGKWVSAGGTAGGVPPTGIRHVIYIIKENRTYDQVLGDDPRGNGDPSLTLFGKKTTPNQHALADRFVLLDNFYCAGEVSADGWLWCVGGMSNAYSARNVPFNYSGRGRDYDFEGAVNGVPVDMLGEPDVAEPYGGYIWDACLRQGVSYRTYGIYEAYGSVGAGGKLLTKPNEPTKQALTGIHTDPDFMRFATRYADSDAWRIDRAAAPKQLLAFGRNHAPDRFSEWKREFDGYVKNHDLPQFEMVRFMRDHTAGTTPGLQTPTAMVADNDYAVGELVDAVSHSPYWASTAIFVVEDDAQDGEDHVDCHRSTCYVISPWVKPGLVDHRFSNTDSVLHTMEALLKLKPMCQFDAESRPLQVFGSTAANITPYDAILPSRAVIAQFNTHTSYRWRDSEKMNFSVADAAPEAALNSIVWHSVKGAVVPDPATRRSLKGVSR
ncbi:MAG: hypothetical protein KGJ62_08895 [Armatimonadetes bacterium]|nr:hypothetical protein [Armatimonadota bacterium]MDE2206464.1 hypothetical protein [Armatimonadota bacterium]